MQKLVFTNGGGQTIDLTSGNFGITNWEGLSGVGLNIQTQQVPFQDGGVFLDALMEQREISVTVAIQDNNDLSARYERKRQLISALNPKLGEGVLVYTNDYLSRQIKAVPQLPIFENKNSNDAGTLKASVVFSCPSPYWEDLEDSVVVIQSGDIETIQNNGDVPAQVKIEMEGIASNPQIKNMTTDKKIVYDSISDGYIEINTNVGEKKVVTKNLVFKLQNFGGEIRSIIYVNDYEKYYAVGSDGVLLTSPDGRNWELKNTGTTRNLYVITYAQELKLFVIVGANGTIMTSSDGENWTSISTETTRTLQVLIYSEEKHMFLVAGLSGTILTSSDGANWTLGNVGSNMAIYGGTYSSQTQRFYLVGIGTTSKGISSSDCITWEDIPLPATVQGQTYTEILFAEGFFVTTTNHGEIYTSQDGTSWTLRYSTSTQYTLEGIAYSETLGIYIVVGRQGTILTSKDAINWEEQAISLSPSASHYLWTAGISNFLSQIIIGGEGTIITSNDGRNFDIIENVSIGCNGVVFAEDKDLIVAVGGNKKVITSNDGYNWQNQETGASTMTTFYDITYSKKLEKFCAVGSAGAIFTSLDGINWTEQTSGTSSDLLGIMYNKNTEEFIAVGVHVVLISSDGVEWESQAVSQALNSITYAYNKQMYIAVGDGAIITSPDGRNWTAQTSSQNIYGIAYSEELEIFVAVGFHAILTSTDGVNWIKRESSKTFYNVYFENNEFLAVGYELYISYDGKSWKSVPTPTTQIIEYDSACWYKDRYLAFSLKEILTSDYKYTNAIQNISKDSDIGFNLVVGENQLRTMKYAGDFVCKVTYRQKYIGV